MEYLDRVENKAGYTKKKGGGGGNLILNKLGVNKNKIRFQLALRCHTYCTVLDKYIIMLLLALD